MRIARYASAQSVDPDVEELDWTGLVQLLTTFRRSKCTGEPCPGVWECPGKNGPAWSPVDIEGQRANDSVRAITFAVFDLDGATEAQLAPLEAIETQGYAHLFHSTHSHAPGTNSLRLVMPLSRAVKPTEWPAVRETAVRLLSIPADPSTKDLSRLYFLPDVANDREPVTHVVQGRPLDVDALLAAAKTGSLAAPAPAPAEELPTDMHELARKLLKHARIENRPKVRAALDGKPLPPGQHDDASNSLMSTAAFVLPTDTPEDAVLELFRGCFAASLKDCGKTLEHHFNEARDQFRRHRERRIKRDDLARAENREAWEKLGAHLRAEEESSTPSEDGDEDPNAWVKLLVTYPTKEGLKLKNCEANLYLVLKHSRAWRGVIRFNVVSKELELHGGPLPKTNPDDLGTKIAVWVQTSDFGPMGLMPKPGSVADVLKTIAHENAFDPLKEWLEGLEWDGKRRLEGLFETYFAAEGVPLYLRTVSAKWAISAVARALKPGCKVDTMLILEGPQGLKKSTAFEVLGRDWFCSETVKVDDKDSTALASRFWILECAEVNTLKREADADRLKAFLSRRVDTYRPPYGRVNLEFERRCVFVGTVNPPYDYLRHDQSGHRRFWPVLCTKIDVEALRRDAPQIWAEAVVRFRAGERWWLDENEAKLAEAEAQERSEITGGPDDLLLEWLSRQPPAKRTDLKTDQLVLDVLQTTPDRLTRGMRHDMARALTRLGYKRKQKGKQGTWVYYAPESIMALPQEHRPGSLQSLVAQKADQPRA